jgi:dTDP-4-amino-4,6-dideoxygalactose transaminase
LLPFIDLKSQQQRIKDDILAAINNVLEHGQYIMGREVFKLEEELSKFIGVKHAVSCSSGTDALLMALMALGIERGDAVFTTPFTFIATAEVISLLGAVPVFVDIDPDTFNIDPIKLEETINRTKKCLFKPKAVITVDLFGLPCDYDIINEIGKKYGLYVIEDAAQGFGGQYKGKYAGSLSPIACTSFFPAKPLGCYGDGGAIFLDDTPLHQKLLSIRIHGQGRDKYENVRIGINGRLDTVQAAILLEKLKIFSEELKLRDEVANKYSLRLKNIVKIPVIPDGYKSAWAQYSVLLEKGILRDKFQNHLKEKGIPTAIYYPIPLHLQKAFSYLSYKEGDFPLSEDISGKIVSLPMHPYLKDEDIDFVCGVIKKFFI